MDKTIVLDCQVKGENFSCEDCILFKECTLNKKNNRTTDETWESDMEIIINT